MCRWALANSCPEMQRTGTATSVLKRATNMIEDPSREPPSFCRSCFLFPASSFLLPLSCFLLPPSPFPSFPLFPFSHCFFLLFSLPYPPFILLIERASVLAPPPLARTRRLLQPRHKILVQGISNRNGLASSGRWITAPRAKWTR